jgi:hypothetical protein
MPPIEREGRARAVADEPLAPVVVGFDQVNSTFGGLKKIGLANVVRRALNGDPHKDTAHMLLHVSASSWREKSAVRSARRRGTRCN